MMFRMRDLGLAGGSKESRWVYTYRRYIGLYRADGKENRNY